jgi:hypothetical protein
MNNVTTVVTNCTTYDLGCVASKVVAYLGVGITVIIALAVATFVWNVYGYFFTEKDKKEAGKYVLFSVIGFFVILSIWGLVNVLSNTFNLPKNQPAWPFGGSVNTGGNNSSPGTINSGFGPSGTVNSGFRSDTRGGFTSYYGNFDELPPTRNQ